MATQSQPQLIRLAEVADTLGAPMMFVANAAGKNTSEWWTGEMAVTFDVAREVAEQWARSVADAEETTRVAVAEQEARISAEREEYARERAAEQHPGGVIPGGVSLSVPGSPRPDWMEGDE
jgi:uncharacterized protein (DUF2342 family)